MRAMQSLCLKWLLFMALGLAGGCSDEGVGLGRSASAQPTSVAKMKEGVRFTIDGPVFGAPTVFVVPGNRDNLQTYLSDSMFSVMFKAKSGLMSEDGKHRLDFIVFGIEPASKGEFTDTSNVNEFSMGFTAHANTAQSQSVSMSFKYSKGSRQPVRLVVERYDTDSEKGGAAGHFTARMQRTNIKSNDQFYEAKGEFKVK